MFIVLIFIFGFFVASVLEWLAYKIPREESMTLKDKLKSCYKYTKRIINKRVIIACLMGIVYCTFYLQYKVSIDFFKYSLACSVLFIVAIIDYKTQDVYFSTTAMALLINLIFIAIAYLNGLSIKTYLFGGVLAGIFSAILAALKVIGWGDVEIFIVCGLLVGTYKLIILTFISVVLCGIYGVYALIGKRGKMRLRVAFGPYIIFALIIVIVFLSRVGMSFKVLYKSF